MVCRVFGLFGQSNNNGLGGVAVTPLEGQLPEGAENLLIEDYPAVSQSIQTYQASTASVIVDQGIGPLRVTNRTGVSEFYNFGPELTLGRDLYQCRPDEWAVDDEIVVLKFSAGGTYLDQWQPGDPSGIWDALNAFIERSIQELNKPASEIVFEDLFWVQGEGDSVASRAPTYAARLLAFEALIQQTYPWDFVFSELKETPDNPTRAAFAAQINADVASSGIPTTGSNNDLSFLPQDVLQHYDATSLLTIGSRLAKAATGVNCMITYTPSGPWTGATSAEPVEVSGDNGVEYLAIGPNSLKRKPDEVEEVVIPEQESLVDGGSNLVNAEDPLLINPLLDCNGEVFDVTDPVVGLIMTFRELRASGVYQTITFRDSGDGCTPAAPNDKQASVFARLETKSPRGDIWQYDATADVPEWVCCNLNPGSNFINVVGPGGINTLDEALGTYAPTPGDFFEMSSITESFTNTDCVPWYYRYDVRVMTQYTAFGPGSTVRTRVIAGDQHTAAGAEGVPNTLFESTGIDNVNQDSQDYMHTWGLGRIDPGETLVLDFNHEVQVVNYTSDANQRVVSNGLGARIDLRRGKAELEGLITSAPVV